MLGALALIGGLVVGNKLKINNESLLGAGLLATVGIPVIGVAPLCFGLGIGVSTLVKNIVTEKYTEKRKELELELEKDINDLLDKEASEIHEEAAQAAKDGFWCFTSTLAFTALPLQLLGLVKGLSGLLMSISIISLVLKGWMYITSNPTKTLTNLLLVALVSGIALTCITNIASGGVLTYFLALISIPSMIIKSKLSTNKDTSNKEKVFSLDSFLYGGNTSVGIVGAAIVLGQTVLWGSGKDVLGTIFNGDYSVLLDPTRLGLLAIILAYLFVKGNSNSLDKNITEAQVSYETKSNKWSKLYTETINNTIKLSSIAYLLLTFNPILVLGLITGGLIINTLDNNNIIRNISIPVLLLVGVLTGF